MNIPMKAIVYHKYGSPKVLKLKEVDKPDPKDDEVLVKVHAASINSWDWDYLVGTSLLTRLTGILHPRYLILGADVGGTVEAVGAKAHKFRVGDAVFGDISESGWGGFAEYVAVSQHALTSVPPSMTFEQAASIPQAGVLALQGLRKYGEIQPGQEVLINGAGGGAGTFAVQIAKSMGATVTGVDSAVKLDKLLELGVDHVIDYEQQDFAFKGKTYDLILDMVAHRPIVSYKRALNPGGALVMIGGSVGLMLKITLQAKAILEKDKLNMGLLLWETSSQDIDILKDYVRDGKITPVIDKVFPFEETADAFRHFESGEFVGKIVVSMG